MRCHYWIFNTRNILETIDSFARGPYLSSFQPICVHFVDKNADRDQNCSFDLKYFQRLGVYTHWFSHMCFIFLLAYKRTSEFLQGKAKRYFRDWPFVYFSDGFIPHLFGDYANLSKWKSDDMKA